MRGNGCGNGALLTIPAVINRILGQVARVYAAVDNLDVMNVGMEFDFAIEICAGFNYPRDQSGRVHQPTERVIRIAGHPYQTERQQ